MPESGWLFSPESYEGETSLKDVTIRAGRIININSSHHVYDVVTDNNETFYNVPMMYPYVSNELGQGFNVIPEVGSRCLIANTINGEDFILGFIVPVGTARLTKLQREQLTSNADDAANTAETFDSVDQKNADSYAGRSGNRTESLYPGDMEIKTSSGNVLRALVGGIIEITGAEGQCFTFYLPSPDENEIMTRTDMLTNNFPSGSMRWVTDKRNSAVRAELELSSSNSDKSDVRMVLGQPADAEGKPDTSNTNKVTISVGPEESPTAEITIDAEGNLTIKNSKKITVESDDEVNVKCKAANIDSSGPVKIKGNKIELN